MRSREIVASRRAATTDYEHRRCCKKRERRRLRHELNRGEVADDGSASAYPKDKSIEFKGRQVGRDSQRKAREDCPVEVTKQC